VSARGTDRRGTSRIVAAVVACLAAGLLLALPTSSAADEIAWMYDPDAVVEIHLGGLSEAELDELEAAPDEYVHGTFELKVDGVTKGVPLADVGIRRKGGFGSKRAIKTEKSGLKVRFDEFVKGQLFFGIKRLTLNNMYQDPSMVHEALSYELFHALDLPASRGGYAFVTLNGAKYGLFFNIETLDEVSLPQWFPTTGHLYEADAAGTDVRPGEASTFEVDEGDDEDLSDLEALIAAANEDEGDWSDGMDTVADMERMTAQWAIERYVAHWDGYAGAQLDDPDPEEPIRPNNYYLHSDAGGIFQMMPWGTDQTWEFDGLKFDDPAAGLMFNACLADASCKDLYLEGLVDVHCVSQDLDQGAHAAQLAAMLEPYQEEEDATRRGYTATEIAEEVQEVEGFADLRPEQLEEYLTDEGVMAAGEDPCPQPPTAPKGPSTPGASSAPPSTPPVPAVFFGRTRVLGGLVSTRLLVPGAGEATQRVTARFGGERIPACLARKRRLTAGQLTVRCRLPERLREALQRRSLRLKVRVDFVPDSGAPAFDVRRLWAKKLGVR
jgi:CotH kinase protein